MTHYALVLRWLLILSSCLSALSAPADQPVDNRVRSVNAMKSSASRENDASYYREITWEPREEPKAKVETCDENNAPGRWMVYCSGKLLQAVNKVQLNKDSKTFVDQPMKPGRTGSQIIQEFEQMFPQPVEEITKDQVQEFVRKHFDEEGHELESCELPDWSSQPKALRAIVDVDLRLFALHLNAIWKELCRQVKPDVKKEEQRFSLIYVPHPFVVPGGRFREFYYWDAYWIIKGLLISGMNTTAKNMILNFAHIIETYGFIPNGGRIYYLRRSQPPLFAPMVYEYYQATRDKDFVQKMLPLIEKEYNFWVVNRNLTLYVDGEPIRVFQYRTPSTVPRPESYREDTISATNITDDKKRQFWQDIASAAESGWDFSIRWFADNHSILSIETTNIVPVDLNAFICYNLHILGNLHGEVGNSHKRSLWLGEYIKFRENFGKVFYVESAKGWYDFNLRTRKHNTEFFLSMAAPLFTQCFEPLSTQKADDLYDRLEQMGVFSFKGGIPTSLYKGTGQQWDFPNGWSPLNHMMIEGLRKSDDPRMQQKAFLLAKKWILGNYHVFMNDQAMWEKYDVESALPRLGGGGEYDVQPGFGWTNGVALDLLVSYGDRLEYTSTSQEKGSASQQTSHSFNIFAMSTVTMILICVQILW